jgi:phosphate uptake regulator
MRRGGSAQGAAGSRAPADPPTPRLEALPAHELGKGRLEPGIPNGRVQKVLHIDVTGAPPNLLGRLLVGSYITGQDQVLVTARQGLSNAQRREIHRVVNRTLGMTVVGDGPAAVEVQNFIDPGKHGLPRLLHRVVQMLRAELAVCRAALTAEAVPQLGMIADIEEEIDRFYLLMVRQLLLSSDNPRIARNIDVESHHYQIGDRLVAKMLEVLGDLIQGIGTELDGNLAGLRRMPPALVHALVRRVDQIDQLLTRTMDAFGHLSVVEANATLNVITTLLPKDARLGQQICRRVENRKVAVAAQRIAYNLDMALEMLIIVNEVTINRGVEPEMSVLAESRASSNVPRSSPSNKFAHSEITILSATPQRGIASET